MEYDHIYEELGISDEDCKNIDDLKYAMLGKESEFFVRLWEEVENEED